MKKTLTLLLMLATGGIYMHAGINIGGIEYSADTIMRRQVGPGDTAASHAASRTPAG